MHLSSEGPTQTLHVSPIPRNIYFYKRRVWGCGSILRGPRSRIRRSLPGKFLLVLLRGCFRQGAGFLMDGTGKVQRSPGPWVVKTCWFKSGCPVPSSLCKCHQLEYCEWWCPQGHQLEGCPGQCPYWLYAILRSQKNAMVQKFHCKRQKLLLRHSLWKKNFHETVPKRVWQILQAFGGRLLTLLWGNALQTT